MPVIVDSDGHLMGAFGAALLAADSHGRRRAGGTAAQQERRCEETGPSPSGEFDFDAAGSSSSPPARSSAARCANHCEIICVYRDSELVDSWGNRCEKGAVRR